MPMDGFFDIRDQYQKLQDKDREVAKWRSDMETARLNQEQQNLANMFDRDTYDTRVKTKDATLEGMQTTNKAAARVENQAQFLAPYEQEAALKELLKKTSKADLDAMYTYGQKLYMDPNSTPEQRRMGQEMVMRHIDFVKLKENLDNKTELQQMRGNTSIQTAGIRAANRGSGGGSTAITEGKVLGPLLQRAVEAQKVGNTELANQYLLEYQRAKQAQAAGRADPNAGKLTITPQGTIGTVPQKGPVTFPAQTKRKPLGEY